MRTLTQLVVALLLCGACGSLIAPAPSSSPTVGAGSSDPVESALARTLVAFLAGYNSGNMATAARALDATRLAEGCGGTAAWLRAYGRYRDSNLREYSLDALKATSLRGNTASAAVTYSWRTVGNAQSYDDHATTELRFANSDGVWVLAEDWPGVRAVCEGRP